MAQENDIVIKVDIDTAQLTKQVEDARIKVNELKKEQQELNAQYKKNQISVEEYTRKTQANKDAIAAQTKVIKDNTTMLTAATVEEVKSTATLNEKRAALNALQKAYGQMTEEQKKAEIGGKTLTERINELSDAVKKEESAIGDNRRNVGNYTESIKQAFPAVGKLGKTIGALKPLLLAGKAGFVALAAGIKAAMLAALKFLATPIGLLIAGIALALKGLVSAFQKLREQIAKNDDASTAFARLYATTVQPIIDGITKVFTKLADIVGKAAGKVADFFAKFSDAGKAADDRVKALDDLQEAERQYTENSAKRGKEVARLRAEAADADKYSVEQRREMLAQAIALEQQDLEESKNIQAEKLRLLEEEARINGDTSDAMKDRIAQARAAMYNAEQEYYTGTRKLQSQMSAFNKEIDNEEQRRLEEYKNRLAERRKAAIEAWNEEREQRIILESVAAKKAVDTRMKIEEETEEENIEEWLAKQKELIEKKRALLQPDLRSDAERQRDEELQWLQELNDAKLLKVEEYEQAKADIEKRYQENQMLMAADAIDAWGAQVMNALSSVNDAISAGENAQLADYKKSQDERKKALDKRLKAGEISQEEYAEQTEHIEEQVEKREKELQREQAKREKALGIMNATISTAAAIIGFLAKPGGIPGIALSAMAGITGAAQIAAIAAQPLPQFERGGTVPGTSYTGDNVLIRANSGEGITTGAQANNLLQEIANNPARGGFDYEAMAAAMSALPAPVMAYSEFKKFEEDVATFNELAEI